MSNANVYISGPISGDRHFLVKFNLAERLLVEKYCTPFCQCFNPAKEQALDKENKTRNEIWGAYLERDLSVMRNLVLQGGITYLVLLPGWKTSKGSCLERAVAESYNMPCMEIRDIFPDWDDLVIAELQRLGIQFEESKNPVFDSPWEILADQDELCFEIYDNKRDLIAGEIDDIDNAVRLSKVPDLYKALVEAAYEQCHACIEFSSEDLYVPPSEEFIEHGCPKKSDKCFCREWWELLKKVKGA